MAERQVGHRWRCRGAAGGVEAPSLPVRCARRLSHHPLSGPPALPVRRHRRHLLLAMVTYIVLAGTVPCCGWFRALFTFSCCRLSLLPPCCKTATGQSCLQDGAAEEFEGNLQLVLDEKVLVWRSWCLKKTHRSAFGWNVTEKVEGWSSQLKGYFASLCFVF